MRITNNFLAALVLVATAVSMTGTVSLLSVLEEPSGPITGMAQDTGSGIANVTLATEASIILLVDVVEFNSIAASVGASNDTTNFSPHPFVVKNNGTARLNISIGESSGNPLWDQNDTGCPYCFQFNSTANNTLTDANQFMAAAWADFHGVNQTATAADLTPHLTPNLVWNLSTKDDYDIITVHLRIEVPQSEEGGVKEATMFFEGVAATQG